MRTSALALLTLTLAFSFAAETRNCTRGIPCGNSCISASKTCRIGGPTSTTDSYRSYAAPAAAGGAVGLAGMAGSNAVVQSKVLYAREDTDVLDRPANSALPNGRLRKGAAVAVQQLTGSEYQQTQVLSSAGSDETQCD